MDFDMRFSMWNVITCAVFRFCRLIMLIFMAGIKIARNKNMNKVPNCRNIIFSAGFLIANEYLRRIKTIEARLSSSPFNLLKRNRRWDSNEDDDVLTAHVERRYSRVSICISHAAFASPRVRAIDVSVHHALAGFGCTSQRDASNSNRVDNYFAISL